jgi:hypothetical protein
MKEKRAKCSYKLSWKKMNEKNTRNKVHLSFLSGKGLFTSFIFWDSFERRKEGTKLRFAIPNELLLFFVPRL